MGISFYLLIFSKTATGENIIFQTDSKVNNLYFLVKIIAIK